LVKLAPAPLDQAAITTCLEGNSDFSFEMQVVSLLESLKVQTEHSGTYIDPVTSKARQFDIRAYRGTGSLARYSLAVECKNIGANFPLVVHAVTRQRSEAFHSVLHFKDDRSRLPGYSNPTVVRRDGIASAYPEGPPVGKAVDQVGFTPSGEPLVSDSDVFEKLSQATNSLRDLIVQSATAFSPRVQVFLPVVVVPDRRLWQVQYRRDGVRLSLPQLVERAFLFVNREWSCELKVERSYPISHIEIVTTTGLTALVTELADPSGLWYHLGDAG
jgi:hypothetical protein